MHVRCASRAIGHIRPLIPAAAAMLLLTACPKTVHTFNPTATSFTSYKLHAGVIDVTGASCTPATPPAPSDPAPPGAAQVLVGYQDWRNTVTDSGGQQCQTSNAKRWEGAVAFDMSGVIADLDAAPYNLLTGKLVYRVADTFQNPQPANAIPMCAARLELAAAAPAATGLVDLNGAAGQDFPASNNPSLAPLSLPHTVPLSGGQAGAWSVDPHGFSGFPRVTVDVTWALSDWAASKAPTLTLVLPPTGPTIAQLGVTNAPPTPIPVSRSTAECRTFIDSLTLTVNVGRN
jgi:hypothetical protein